MKIILAYDDSEPSQRALHTLAWFSAIQPEVSIVFVLPGMVLSAEGEPTNADPDELKEAEDALRRALAVVESHGLTQVKTEVLIGEPRHALLEKALKDNANLIITGSRGRGLAKRMVFGSVSNVILHDAECPVMVVK